MPVNRIDITGLIGKDESVRYDLMLPEEVSLSCPRCGCKARDRGKFKINFDRVPSRHIKSGYMLVSSGRCEECGYFGSEIGA